MLQKQFTVHKETQTSGISEEMDLEKQGIANAAISSSISAIAFVDHAGNIIYVNPAFVSMWGYESCMEIVGKSASRFWHHKGLQRTISRKLHDKGGWIGELRALGNSEREFPVQVSATVLTDTENKSTYTMYSFIDISERVNAQKEQVRLVKELSERVKELSCLYQILSTPFSADSSLEDILRSIVTAIPPSMQWPDAIYARIVVGTMEVCTSNYKPEKHPLIIPLNLSGIEGYLEAGYCSNEQSGSQEEFHFLEEEKNLLKAAALEITRLIEQKRMENELRIHRERLLHADKMASIGVLSTEIMHEIGNPNNFIAMNTRMLLRAWDTVLPILDAYYRENGNFSVAGIPFTEARMEIPKLLAGISEGSERIRDISSRLKGFATSSVDSAFLPFNINNAISRAIEFTRDCIESSTRKFTVQMESTSQTEVNGNSRQIQQVLINLITNSCQALTTPEQRISITTDIEQEDNMVIITIDDEGCGINLHEISRIFDPFYSTKRERGNSGLGLSISEDIAEKHGGKIKIQSRPGHGTHVRFTLPVFRFNTGAVA